MHIKKILGIVTMLLTVFAYSQDQYYAFSNLDSDLKEDANAVIKSSDIDIVVEAVDEMHIKRDLVITVINEKGNGNVESLVGYDKYNKIKKIEAVIYDEFGNEVKKFKKRDFIDHSAVDGGTLYSDSRLLYMPYTPTVYPYTVHFSYEIQTENTGAIPSWRPINGYYVSVENANYTVLDKAGIGLELKAKNLDGLNIESDNTPQSIHYTLKQVPFIKPEELSPDLSTILPVVMVRTDTFSFYGVEGAASNWVEFGDWVLNSLLRGRDQVSDKTKKEILDLVSTTDDTLEKAKLIYQYVQENTRYISVQVGIGGIQPIPAMEVDNLKYGDCKGLTNYTAALLEVAGIPSYYSIVEAGDAMIDFEDDFPSIEQGNHIILGIPYNNDIVWADCTSQYHPLGFIGDFTDNRKVLAVKEGASEIIKTAQYTNDENHQLTTATINLGQDGNLSSNVSIQTRGIQYDHRFMLPIYSDKEIKEFYKRIWGDLSYLKIASYKFENNKEQVVFTEDLKVEVGNYASFLENKLVFSPNVFDKNTYVPKRYRNRHFPFEIQRGYVDEDNNTITIPEGYTADFLPEDISVKTEFGSYEVSFDVVDNKLQYHRKLFIKQGLYPNTKYEAYRKFRKTISKSDKLKIILKKDN